MSECTSSSSNVENHLEDVTKDREEEDQNIDMPDDYFYERGDCGAVYVHEKFTVNTGDIFDDDDIL